MPKPSRGEIAYQAYGNEVGWVNHLGLPMPAWEGLPLIIQRGWHEAAAAIANLTLQEESQNAH